MSNEIATQGTFVPTVASKYSTPEVAKSVATNRAFLPQIRVMGSNTGAVKNGTYPHMGTFALVEGAGTKFTNYGKELTALLVSWRPRAICYRPTYMNSFNPQSDIYKTIVKGQQAGGPNNPNAVGPEFLIWIFEHGVFAEFFHGNASLSNEGAIGIGIFEEQNQKQGWIPVSFKCELAVKKAANQSWHTSRLSRYTSEISPEKFPPIDELVEIRERFNNPKEANVETAETDAASDDGHVR